MPRSLSVAACAYGVRRHASWDAFAAHLGALVADAADAGARLLVVPEYAAMELAQLPPGAASLGDELDVVHRHLPAYVALHDALARQHGLYLIAGSIPVRGPGGTVRNRAFVFGPSGPLGHQDKQTMTRFEDETWGVAKGEGGLKVFDVDGVGVAVAICYDAEFPRLVRAAADAGAEVVAVPSCTDTRAGFHRVQIGCRARALENQCFVVQAPLVGRLDGSETVDVNVGAAGIFTPVDRGFPDDGVLALGPMDAPALVVADLDLDQMAEVRRNGQVLNFRDGGEDG